jgi:hypothetical protein
MFRNQDMWYNEATQNMTMSQVIDSLASFAHTAGFVTKDDFLAGMISDEMKRETRISWKYGCSRGECIQGDTEKM